MRKLFLIVAACTMIAAAQEPKHAVKSFSPDDSFIIREISAIVVPKKEKLVVEMVLGGGSQQPQDIQKSDELLMLNGKKITSLKDLKSAYETVKSGDEVKIGVRRGSELMMVKFVKKTEAELDKSDRSSGRMMIRMDKNEGDEIIMSLGIIIGGKQNQVAVKNILPSSETVFKAFSPKEGDIVVSVNGTAVKKAVDFTAVFDKVKEGEEVSIVFSRNGKESTESFKKPKPTKRVMMKQ